MPINESSAASPSTHLPSRRRQEGAKGNGKFEATRLLRSATVLASSLLVAAGYGFCLVRLASFA